jgi:hypothetical protein
LLDRAKISENYDEMHETFCDPDASTRLVCQVREGLSDTPSRIKRGQQMRVPNIAEHVRKPENN